MFRRNPDLIAIGFVMLVLGTVSAIGNMSNFVVRNLSEGRQQHLERKVELIGEHIERKAEEFEKQATRIAQRAEQVAQHAEQMAEQHAARAERLAKVLE